MRAALRGGPLLHIWSLDAAITARYLQDKVSFQAAEDYRRAVFFPQRLKPHCRQATCGTAEAVPLTKLDLIGGLLNRS